MDHLKLEDSYSHSRSPFSDTMRALTDMYGQPHQLALQLITSLMDGPNIKSGDVKAFKAFTLCVPCTYPEHEKPSPSKDKKSGFTTRKVTTVLHGGEQKGVSAENPMSGSVSSDKMQEKPKRYCLFCNPIQHYMNQCSNFKLLTKEQVENWIKMGRRCWRCG